MCTLTIIPAVPGASSPATIIINRDEQRSRPAAWNPRVHAIPGAPRWAGPVDPQGGGTWIGVSESGIAAAILNVNPEPVRTLPGAAMPARSRGVIVPAVLRGTDWTATLALARAIEPHRYAPFRLVMTDGVRLAEVHWDGRRMLTHEAGPMLMPVMRTSSGLGDSVVEGPRRALFEALFKPQPPERWARVQREYHAHRWADRRELSVLMAREDACTVSRTTVTISAHGSALHYQPRPEHEPERVERIALARAGQMQLAETAA